MISQLAGRLEHQLHRPSPHYFRKGSALVSASQCLVSTSWTQCASSYVDLKSGAESPVSERGQGQGFGLSWWFPGGIASISGSDTVVSWQVPAVLLPSLPFMTLSQQGQGSCLVLRLGDPAAWKLREWKCTGGRLHGGGVQLLRSLLYCPGIKEEIGIEWSYSLWGHSVG